VELGHLVLGGLVGPVHLHLPVETIVQQQVVGHSHPVGLHGVALAVVVVADIRVIVIANLRLAVLLHPQYLLKKVNQA